jgi:hypothetical protein
MFRRIGEVVFDLSSHAAAAREISLGLYGAIAFLVRGRTDIDGTFVRHDAVVEHGLGF